MIRFEGELPNEEKVLWFGFLRNFKPMAHSQKNHFYQNSISYINIQESDSSLWRGGTEKGGGERQRSRLVPGVEAVAQLDKWVCQRGRPCSLMMAMPAHKPSPTDMCVRGSFYLFIFFQDG